MKITIKPEVFQKIDSQFKVGFILASGIDNKSKATKVDHLLAEMQKAVLLSFNKDTVKTHHLISPWNSAKEEFGPKAKHYHTSVELLLQKALRKEKLQAKDTVTALLRYLALKHIVPFGVDDPAKIKGEISFEVKKGDLQYRDASQVLGKKLDYWKNSKTAVKASSKSALIHFEFLPPVSIAKQREILTEAVELIKAFCGGKTKVEVVDKKKNPINL